MPPAYNAEQHNRNGWKVAMGMLMLGQAIALGAMWRTYDAITDLKSETITLRTRLDADIRPTLDRHERKLDELSRADRIHASDTR